MARPNSRRQTALLVRNYVEALTGLALLFVVQAGLMPFHFDFGRAPGGAGSHVFFDTSTYDLLFADIVSNLFLYFPLGALLSWSLDRRLGNGLLAAVGSILLCAVVSFLIEYAQAFAGSRVSSLIDLTSNVTGAAVGALFSWAARWVIPRLVATAIVELRQRPSALMLKAYCGILVFFAAMPFSLSFDLGRLKEAVKAVNLTPFSFSDEAYAHLRSSTVRSALGAARDADPTGSSSQSAALGQAEVEGSRLDPYADWLRAKRWARWSAEGASFFLLVALLIPVLRDDYGFSRKATVALVFWQSCLFAVLLSSVQLLIISRACDVTDVLFRIAGALVGLITWSHRSSSEHGEVYLRVAAADQGPLRWQRLARVGCFGCVGYIAYTALIPFDYSWGVDHVFESVAAPQFLPFLAYFTGRFDLMMADFVEKVSAYAVLAALVASYFPVSGGLSLRARFGPAAAGCLFLSVALEVAQMFNPIRVTSLTDPMVALAGACVGVLIQEQARRLYRLSGSLEELGVPPAALEGRGPSLSLTDELIATLTEPQVDAPSEPSGPRRAPAPTHQP